MEVVSSIVGLNHDLYALLAAIKQITAEESQHNEHASCINRLAVIGMRKVEEAWD